MSNFVKLENKALGTMYIARDNISEFALKDVDGKFGLAMYTKIPQQLIGFSFDTAEERACKIAEILNQEED